MPRELVGSLTKKRPGPIDCALLEGGRYSFKASDFLVGFQIEPFNDLAGRSKHDDSHLRH